MSDQQDVGDPGGTGFDSSHANRQQTANDIQEDHLSTCPDSAGNTDKFSPELKLGPPEEEVSGGLGPSEMLEANGDSSHLAGEKPQSSSKDPGIGLAAGYSSLVGEEKGPIKDPEKLMAADSNSLAGKQQISTKDPENIMHVDSSSLVGEEHRSAKEPEKGIAADSSSLAGEEQRSTKKPEKVMAADSSSLASEEHRSAKEPEKGIAADSSSLVGEEQRSTKKPEKVMAADSSSLASEEQRLAKEPETVMDVNSSSLVVEEQRSAKEPKKIIAADSSSFTGEEQISTKEPEKGIAADSSSLAGEEQRSTKEPEKGIAADSSSLAGEEQRSTKQPEKVMAVDSSSLVSEEQKSTEKPEKVKAVDFSSLASEEQKSTEKPEKVKAVDSSSLASEEQKSTEKPEKVKAVDSSSLASEEQKSTEKPEKVKAVDSSSLASEEQRSTKQPEKVMAVDSSSLASEEQRSTKDSETVIHIDSGSLVGEEQTKEPEKGIGADSSSLVGEKQRSTKEPEKVMAADSSSLASEEQKSTEKPEKVKAVDSSSLASEEQKSTEKPEKVKAVDSSSLASEEQKSTEKPEKVKAVDSSSLASEEQKSTEKPEKVMAVDSSSLASEEQKSTEKPEKVKAVDSSSLASEEQKSTEKPEKVKAVDSSSLASEEQKSTEKPEKVKAVDSSSLASEEQRSTKQPEKVMAVDSSSLASEEQRSTKKPEKVMDTNSSSLVGEEQTKEPEKVIAADSSSLVGEEQRSTKEPEKGIGADSSSLASEEQRSTKEPEKVMAADSSSLTSEEQRLAKEAEKIMTADSSSLAGEEQRSIKDPENGTAGGSSFLVGEEQRSNKNPEDDMGEGSSCLEGEKNKSIKDPENGRAVDSSSLEGEEQTSIKDSGNGTSDSSSLVVEEELPIKDLENVVSVVFHLYVQHDAEKVFIEFEKQLKLCKNVTLDLECMSGSDGYGKYWKSRPTSVYLGDTVKYRYIIRYHHGNVIKALYFLKNTLIPVDSDVKEAKFKRTVYPRTNQYDVFKQPKNPNYNEAIFAGHFFFVNMLYDSIQADGTNLKEAMSECEHIGFGNPDFTRKDRQSFFEWVSTSAMKELTPPKSAFICALIGQFFINIDAQHSVSCRLPHGKKAVDALLFHLRHCPKECLPNRSLEYIKDIATKLLFSSSYKSSLGYVLNFGHLFPISEVLNTANELGYRYTKHYNFDQIAAQFVEMLVSLKDKEWQQRLLNFVIEEAPAIDSLWNIWRQLNSQKENQLVEMIEPAVVHRFTQFLNQARKPDLLQTLVWKYVPDVLKPKLAIPFFEELIDQLKTSRFCDYGILKDVILDRDLQKWATTRVVKLLKFLSRSRDKGLTDVTCDVLNVPNMQSFWEKIDHKERENILLELVLTKVQSRISECSFNKEKVVGTFQVLQELSDIRAIKQHKDFIELLGENICHETQRFGLRAIVDAYDEIQSSSGEIAKEWYTILLKSSLEQQKDCSNDMKMKVIEVVRSTSYGINTQALQIDGGREMLLLMLVEHARLPKTKGKIDQLSINKIMRSVLSDKETWTIVFQVTGKVDRLHSHPNYITVVKAITWLRDSIINGHIAINFIKSEKDQDDVAELLAVTRCRICTTSNPKVTSLYDEWQEKLVSLSKEKTAICEVLDHLKRAFDLASGIPQGNSLVYLKDFDDVVQEYNERKSKIQNTFFADIRKKDYWGSLQNLLSPAKLLHEFTLSPLFVNFAVKLVEEEVLKKKQATEDEMYLDEEEYSEKIQDEDSGVSPDAAETNCMTVEELFVLLTRDGISKLTNNYERILKMKVSSEEVDVLFAGVKRENIKQELEFVGKLLGKSCPPYNIIRILENYAKYEDMKERTQKALECLHTLDYKKSGSSCDVLRMLESFIKCKESGTLESLSKQIDSIMIKKLDEQLEPGLVAILSELSEAVELMNFIVETAKDNMADLVDGVEERSDQLIQESTVSDLIDVHRFLSDLLSNKPDKPDDFLDKISSAYKNLLKDNSSMSVTFERSSWSTTKMAAKIKVCSCNVHSLRGLYMTLSNRGEMTKEIIKSAVNDGCYQVGKADDGSIQVFLTYFRKDQTESEAKYNMDDLNDLRSRALLIVNTDKSNRNEVERESSVMSEELYQFIEQVDLITEITRKYDLLKKSGIPKYGDSFWKTLKSIEEIRIEENKVEEELMEWILMLHTVRKENFFLNYFHATQLWELKSFFERPPQSAEEVTNKVLALFHCIDKHVTKEELLSFQSKYKQPKDKDTPTQLRAIGSALEGIFRSSHQKPLPSIVFTKKVDGIVEPGKLYVAVLEPGSAQTVHVVMALFLNTCASPPRPSELLFCHSQTSWEEIELFLFRTFEAHSHGLTCKLHCLANVESLQNDIQFQLVNNLKLLPYEVQTQYLLAVVCRGGSHHHIADQFGDQAHYFGGMADSDLREKFEQECPQTFLVTSDLPGLGKSEEIYSHALETKKDLVSFPISGPFSRKSLVERFSSLQLKKFQALHLDIGEVDDPNGLDTFLFELIVTGMVASEAQLFSLPTSQIYIEVANTLQQGMRDSLPICKCFKRLQVQWKDCDNLMSSTELTSPVQVVCQYLHAYESETLESQEVILSGPKRLKPLSTSKCKELLSKHFFSGEDLSFNILENFMSVLADQLIKFTRSPFLKPQNLVDMVGKSHDVRVRLFKALLEVATSFAARSINTCKSAQAKALDEGQSREPSNEMQFGAGTTAEQMVDRVKEMIHWADNEHLVIMLHGAGAVTAIYRDLNKVPQGVKDLYESQSMKGKGNGLEDYKTMSQDELQIRLERISDSSEKVDKAELQSLGYALTPDNILKMALIIQRMQANIPVIVMGETGCGKTSLVQYLAKTCNIPFDVFNFHAGITEKEIVDFIFSKDEEARTLLKKGKSMWIFLDEINTCDYLGTINEIVCHGSLYGKPLAPNLVFVAACNPYRLRPPGRIMTAGLGGKTTLDEYSKLVYRVHPLPETMIDYVWDYGSLSEDDEWAYIGRMIEGLFDESDRKLLVELLAASQGFVRRADHSPFCVSLRDVHRTTILIKWFYNMLKNRPSVHHTKLSYHIQKYFITAKKFDLKERSIVLALSHCYLSRLPTTALRQAYCKEMTRIFEKNMRHNFSSYRDGFEQIIRAEQEDYLSRMELPEGTARNAALRENVFVILVCILNRIPVFVVGKPGCSKSLSMQVIRSNLRGRDSKDPFLKTLPQLFVVSFQGSESSTSEGIEKVFEKARKYNDKAENVLPVVLLDEIGLAEVSKFNPLKVLHRLLEPGKGEFPDVAVVGISNWALDAAKMNRAVHLSRPEPDKEDLYETGLSIREVQINKPGDSRILRSGESRYKKQLKCLAEAYHEYQSEQNHKNFHGLRDYYSMVKCLEISTSKSEENNENIQRAMQRNFGGLPKGKEKFQALFLEKLKIHQATEDILEFPVTDLIRDNLHDKLARHLMIITSGDSPIDILNQTLVDLNREKITIFGSHFEEDLSADYNHRVLSRIILWMEQKCVLILRDLEGIYGSLYDMLNQNYIVVGGKKNCRIALGAFSNPMCQVDDGFRCIVLVDENKVDYSDPPFLNRFEKQLLRFSDVLDDNQKVIIEELREWVMSISTVSGHEKEFCDVDMFAGFHEDTLPSLVLFHSRNDGTTKEEVIACCKDDLMFVATPDAVIRTRKSLLYDNNDEEVIDLCQNYFEKPIHQGLKHFLKHSIGDHCNRFEELDSDYMKLLVMTHSSIHADVSKCVEGLFLVQTEKLSFFKSEKELSKRIQYFWGESKANLLVVQCRPDTDAPHMLLVKSIIEQQRKEYIDSPQPSKSRKHVCIVIHLQHEVTKEEDKRSYCWQFNFLSGWRQVMIDVLEKPIILLRELLGGSVISVLDSETLPFNKLAGDQLLWCFTRIKYPPLKQPEVSDIIALVETITSSASIMECFKKLCCQWIQNEENNPESGNSGAWQVSVACDRKLLINCSTLVKAMQYYVTHLVRRPLAKIIYFLQKESAWKVLTECEEEKQDECMKLLSMNSVFNINDIPDPQDAESLIVNISHLELQFPFSCLFFKRVEGVYEFFAEEYRRKCLEEEGALDKNEDLSTASRRSLIIRVSRKVQQIITEMIDSDYLVSKVQDYLDDVLDIKSEEFSQCLSRHQRIEILKAHFVEHIPTINLGETNDVPHLVTQLHVLLWMEGDTIPPLLNFVQACIPVVPSTIEELIQTFSDMKRKAMEVVKQKEGPLKLKESATEADIDNIAPSEGIQHKGIQKENDVYTKGNEMGPCDSEKDEQHFQHFLVQEICASLLPTDDFIESTGGIEAWKSLTNFVLSTATKYYTQVPAFHFLKVCYDFSTLVHSKSEAFSLYALGELGKSVEEEKYLDSTRNFFSICESIEDLREEGEDEEKLDEFIFLLYARCIESNQDTPLMGEILGRISSNEDERLFQLAVPILYRIFRTEEAAFSPENFGITLKSLEDLDNFPNLVEIKTALSDMQQSGIQELDWHFNVICCDVINRMAFKDLNLNDVSSSDVDVLNNFHQAIETLISFDEDNDGNLLFGFICAVSYLRAFISAIARFLIEHRRTLYKGKYDFLLSDIFKDLKDETLLSRKGSLNLFLINELRQRSSMYEIRQLINSCTKLHYLKMLLCEGKKFPMKLDYDPFQSLAESSDAKIAFGKDGASLESHQKRFKFASIMIEQFYLVRSIRTLKDTEDEAAQYITKNLESVSEPYKRFLLRIANQKSFKCQELQVTPESKAIDVEVAVLVQHVSAIITSRFTGKSRNPVVCCLVDPKVLKGSYLLAAPTNNSGYEHYEIFETVWRPYILYYSCGCGIRFATTEDKPQSSMRCPNCNISCEKEEMPDGKSKSKSLKGYIHCDPDSMLDEMLCTRNLNPVEFRILHLIIHLALVAGYSLELSTKELVDLMKVDNPSDVCFQYIQCDLDVLSKIFCCTKERIIAFAHHILKEVTPLLTEDSGLPLPHDENTRLTWESDFSKRIRPLVQKFRKNDLKPRYEEQPKNKADEFEDDENESDGSESFGNKGDGNEGDDNKDEENKIDENDSDEKDDEDEEDEHEHEHGHGHGHGHEDKHGHEDEDEDGDGDGDEDDDKKKDENKVDKNEDDENDLEIQIEELKEPKSLDAAARNVWLPRFFLTKQPNSFEKLREFYLNSSEDVKQSHQLFGLFLDYHKTLGRIGNLITLNSWIRRVDVLLSRRLTRAEAKMNQIGDTVIRKEPELKKADADSASEESLRNAFKEFSKAWENVVPLFNDSLGNEKHISEISPVGFCLVERRDLGRYLCATLVGLANMQNEFLDKSLAIAASGSCPALQFLCKNGTICSFPSVHVQDAKEKEIIRYEWTDRLLDHSRYDTEYGHGSEIFYDIAKIEKDMAGRFLLGKAYLTTSKGMREFVFSKQLFHDCANILNDLHQAIPQEILPGNVEAELLGSVTKRMYDTQVLLEHMEIVLCFLKRTGGKPEESLLDYVETWMTASRPFPKELLPKTKSALQLRHVCALYEFLEDKLAVSAVGCVGEDYQKPLSDEIKLELDNNEILQDEGKSQRILDATVTAIQRFIFRYLNMKPAAKKHLVEFMEDPSLWPMRIRAVVEDHDKFKIKEVVPILFPKMLTIAQTLEVHKYYQERLSQITAKKPLQSRSNRGSSAAPRPRTTTTRRQDNRNRGRQTVGEGFT